MVYCRTHFFLQSAGGPPHNCRHLMKGMEVYDKNFSTVQSSKDRMVIRLTAEVRKQSPRCGAGVAAVRRGRFGMFLTRVCHRDAASRRALQLALQQLAESQPEATARNLLHSLQSSGIGSRAAVPRWVALCGSTSELLAVPPVQNEASAAAWQRC